MTDCAEMAVGRGTDGLYGAESSKATVDVYLQGVGTVDLM